MWCVCRHGGHSQRGPGMAPSSAGFTNFLQERPTLQPHCWALTAPSNQPTEYRAEMDGERILVCGK